MHTLCKTSEVEPGTVKRVEVDGLPPLAIYNLAGSGMSEGFQGRREAASTARGLRVSMKGPHDDA